MKKLLCIVVLCFLPALSPRAFAADPPVSSEDPVMKRKFTALGLIWQDVEAEEPGSAARKGLLAEFLTKSSEYLSLVTKEDQTAGQAWTFRALAACELGEEKEARAAGKAMLDLGLGDGKRESQLITGALALLERKGWMEDSTATLRKKAEAGDPSALFKLSKAYDNGDGVERDFAEARRLLHKAADKGFADALWEISFSYRDQDPAKAVKLLRQAADQGHSNAQVHMGFLYRDGTLGVKKNKKEARVWFQKAWDSGNEHMRIVASDFESYMKSQ